ncbi:hypothetical protein LTR78_006291 [Recurvomyces mirabilis]|uniref:Uncharacterized protein n=1 Tax=Recurvomyces mirabilis TaxID=574656 RepID=A0AAE0WL67_9PEZI|nr:hypothetical protein LTR78_006291 [Recurvomyces mirabilis]KAK5152180.1 hypothetical protein LTS14_008555 [Recurvomyces mirabilis]
MRSALAAAATRRAGRSRSTSLSAVPPSESSHDYVPELAAIAASILYRSPLPSREGRPIFVLNAAAFPDAWEVDYDSLLSYVLARLPGEEELISGTEYEIVFFAGGQPEGATSEKKQGPGMGWYLQAYHVLSRATRKKLQKLYIVHPRTWVRVLVGVFGTIVSPKFRRKIMHVNTLSQLALQVPIERLLIPPSTYLQDRKMEAEIDVPYMAGRRAFGARHPLPKNLNTGKTRLPRVLRETTSFLMLSQNVVMEGLFRIPPHSVLAGVLKEAYDRGQHFIVWKEKGATVVQPGIDQGLLDEVRLEDAYGVHLAASMIKMWYRELRDPIFPESSYAGLREKCSSPDAQPTLEELVELILPASPLSPLTSTSREILTRHLLPLLSAIAEREAQNKMNAENLSILFSMCLVCGTNQLEDAKMANVIKKVLQKAIAEWPLLREGLGINRDAFAAALLPPSDRRDYEDPVDDESHTTDPDDNEEGHRILMADIDGTEEIPEPKPVPILPPRSSGMAPPRKPSPSSLTSADNSSTTETKRAPTLPPRPLARSRAASAARQQPLLPSLDVVGVGGVKRKPAPMTAQAPDSAPALLDPPGHSTVFDSEGRSLHVADSPASYAPPADGFGPARRGKSVRVVAADEEKKGLLPTYAEPEGMHPALNVPKRKAVSGDVPDTSMATGVQGQGSTRSASEGSMVANMAALAARRGASMSSQRDGAEGVGEDPIISEPSSEGALGSTTDERAFRKPSWPASAMRRQQPRGQNSTPMISAQERALLPSRQSRTLPQSSTSSTITNGLQPPPSAPRHRAPSPGLLKRMETMEATSSQRSSTAEHENGYQPRRLNLKKTSVDDLRRLYEERVGFAEGLRRMDVVRRRRGSSGVGEAT